MATKARMSGAAGKTRDRTKAAAVQSTEVGNRPRISFDIPPEVVYEMRRRLSARKYQSGKAAKHSMSSLVTECIRAHLETLNRTEGPV